MNTFLFYLCCGLIVLYLGSVEGSLQQQFDQFKVDFNKKYETKSEELKRFGIFKQNMIESTKLQLRNRNATFGVTKFSDLTKQEFKDTFLMKLDLSNNIEESQYVTYNHNAKPSKCNPNSVSYDWRDCGVITPVKNQGECGDPWVFPVVENVESYCALYGGGILRNLSNEEVLDCNSEQDGCNGGYPQYSYDFIAQQGGLETESDYPYVAQNGIPSNCTIDKKKNKYCPITGWVNMTGGEPGLYKQLSSNSGGPVCVCVDAQSWQMYTGGILTNCGQELDHCAQLTGYSNYGDPDAYWLVRNQWGTDWGVEGYIYIAIGSDLCGIAQLASYPTL